MTLRERPRAVVPLASVAVVVLALLAGSAALSGHAAAQDAAPASPAAPAIAFVHVGRPLAALLDAPESVAASEALANELTAKDQDYLTRLADIRKALQAQPQGSPEGQALYEEGGKLAQEHAQWRQEALARRGKLDSERIESAYRKVVIAVRAVAARRGVDVVQPFVPVDEPFDAEDPDRAMLSVRLRTAIVLPTGLDLTDDVMVEMGLQD
jgi:Skp family chaperone for outer membrane proteins